MGGAWDRWERRKAGVGEDRGGIGCVFKGKTYMINSRDGVC